MPAGGAFANEEQGADFGGLQELGVPGSSVACPGNEGAKKTGRKSVGRGLRFPDLLLHPK